MKIITALLLVLALTSCADEPEPEVSPPTGITPPDTSSPYVGDWEWSAVSSNGRVDIHGIASVEAVLPGLYATTRGAWAICTETCPEQASGRARLTLGQDMGLEKAYSLDLFEEKPNVSPNQFLNASTIGEVSSDAQGFITFSGSGTVTECYGCVGDVVSFTVTQVSREVTYPLSSLR